MRVSWDENLNKTISTDAEFKIGYKTIIPTLLISKSVPMLMMHCVCFVCKVVIRSYVVVFKNKT